MAKGKPFKLWLKEKLVEGAILSGAFALPTGGVTYLAREETWVHVPLLITAGALALAGCLYYLSTLLKPRYVGRTTREVLEDWTF